MWPIYDKFVQYFPSKLWETCCRYGMMPANLDNPEKLECISQELQKREQ